MDFRERVSRSIWPSKLGLSSYRILPARGILSFGGKVRLLLYASAGWEESVFCRRSPLSRCVFKRSICRGGPSVLSQTRKQRSAFFEHLSARVLRRGLKKLEIRDYALRSAGGLSEATPSCALLISAFSIVPDFLVFAATEPWSRSHPHTRAEYVFDTSASVFSDVLLLHWLPRKYGFHILKSYILAVLHIYPALPLPCIFFPGLSASSPVSSASFPAAIRTSRNATSLR